MRPGVRKQRSGTEWTVRAVLAVGGAFLGYLSVATTLGYAVRGSNPEQAYRLAPWDGRVVALLARSRAIAPDVSMADRAVADRLALKALRLEPVNVVAATTLAIDATARGNQPGAKKALAYAESLSRRDLQTELMAIELAVNEGDVRRALRHYDIALRISPEANDLLFPVLSGAISDPTVRAALVKTLARQPVWWGSFLDYASGNGPDPRATASLMLALHRTGTPIPPSAGATIVSHLIQRAGIDAAWRYYAASRGGLDPRQSRDPEFRSNPTPPSLFDWVAVDDGNVSVAIQPGGVDFSAPAGISGLLLQQGQMLPPGRYRLDGVSAGLDQSGDALPYWVLSCRNGRELGRVALQPSGTAGGRFGGDFVVPPDCPAQTLSLMARSTDAVGGLSGRITRVALRPESTGTPRQ